MWMKRLRCLVACLAAASASLAASCWAQPYPSRPITIVVPFTAGGAVDAMARLLAVKLAERTGESVVVDNRAGAGGAIGMASVARSKADGYTLLYTPNSIAIGPALYRKLPFDAEKDLVPVTQVIASTLVLVVPPRTAVGSVKELVSLARAKPGKLNFGSSGVADPLQLGVEMLKTSTGIDMQAIPYKGQAPMLQALLAGEVDLAIVSLQLGMPSIRAGSLLPLAVTGARRSAALPQVPTVAEGGIAGFDLSSWHGLFAPAGTPKPVVDKLQQEIAAIVQLPDVRKAVESAGNEVVANTPEEFQAKFTADVAMFKKIAKDAQLPFQD